MGHAQINVRTRACSRTFIVRSKQAALTHNISGKEIIMVIRVFVARNVKMICSVIVV